MIRLALLLPLLALTACASPLQRCIASETEEVRTLERLIAETQANLDRGYAQRQEVVDGPRVTFCGGYGHGHRSFYGLNYCHDPYPRTRTVPEAIDRESEQRKLRDLTERLRAVTPRAQVAAQQCRAKYGDG
ncbi:hypothetical protein DDZ14_11195 [Maritimibacter sp. 55A14]|uniref:hypothetical protein n=1 Tax=Maritimibacter sp. 55A14 TaxID=2174844 RepID=UPI000D607A2B|nr:hypothetical protein [Maritimibacter sp. 55A14]PWE32286.1 hypothetical protein DDZ14_11195 [Maritimibacter sp. 55A14]